jgi:hypothetical protein
MAARWPRAEALAAAMMPRTYQERRLQSNRSKTTLFVGRRCRRSWPHLPGYAQDPAHLNCHSPHIAARPATHGAGALVILLYRKCGHEHERYHKRSVHRLQSDLSDAGDETPQQSPAEKLLEDCDIFALMPPSQQTIWPRVWPGL